MVETPTGAQPGSEAPVRLVVVEDQPQMLRSLLKLLAAHRDRVEVVATATDGEAAVREALRVVPDLMLLDLELPSMDGIEVTRRVKAARPEIDVLVLTSFDDERKVYEAICAGASGYLVKRVGGERILEAIREVRLGGTVLEPVIARRFWNLFQSVRARPPQPRDPWGLTPQELEVLHFIARGLSNAEVGRVMSLERRTVRTHLTHIYRKMGVSTHVEAVTAAIRAGMVEL